MLLRVRAIEAQGCYGARMTSIEERHKLKDHMRKLTTRSFQHVATRNVPKLRDEFFIGMGTGVGGLHALRGSNNDSCAKNEMLRPGWEWFHCAS